MQQQNFKDILLKMSLVPGWNTLEYESLLALKAPSSVPFVNMVWGKVNELNYNIVKSFYNNAPYNWHLTSTQKNELPESMQELFKSSEEFPEMMLNLNEYITPIISPKIKVIIAKSDNELQQWTDVAISTFGCSENGFKEFFYPLIETIECVPFLILYENEPAATSMVYCSKDTAGIYTMSTKEKFRRNGLGTAALNSCIEFAKRKNLKNAVLYASKLGEPLYKKSGFKITQLLHEYCFMGTEI